MSTFLDFSSISGGGDGGSGGSCSVRAYHGDHGLSTFQSSCAVRVNSCSGDERFMSSRSSQDAINPQPHQAGSYQSPGTLSITYSAHPSYGTQSFCSGYSHYALNQDVDSSVSFPQCGPLVYSGNISSTVVQHHRHGYSGGNVHLHGQFQYASATYGNSPDQANLTFVAGCSNPLSPLHVSHHDACCSPLSDGVSTGQTFDWMKVKRNPPKTGECLENFQIVSVCFLTDIIFMLRLKKKITFQTPWLCKIVCVCVVGMKCVRNACALIFLNLFFVSLQGKLGSMDLVGSQTLYAPILPQNSWQSLKRSFISISTWLARGVWRSRLRSNWTRLRWRFGSKIAVWSKRNAKRKVFCLNLRPNWRMVSKNPRTHPKSRSPHLPRPLPLPRLLMPTPRIKRRLFCPPVIAELLLLFQGHFQNHHVTYRDHCTILFRPGPFWPLSVFTCATLCYCEMTVNSLGHLVKHLDRTSGLCISVHSSKCCTFTHVFCRTCTPLVKMPTSRTKRNSLVQYI